MRALLILLVTFLIGCSSPSWMSVGHSQMFFKYNKDFTIEQFDSICKTDTIPSDFKKWKTVPLLDDEDNTKIKRYMFIKKLTPEQIYVATDKDSVIQITKRIAL